MHFTLISRGFFFRAFEEADNFIVQFMLWSVGFHWKQTRTVSDFDFPNFWKFTSKTGSYWRHRISLVFVKDLRATESFEKKTRIFFHIMILWLYLIVKKAVHAVCKSWEAMQKHNSCIVSSFVENVLHANVGDFNKRFQADFFL